MHNWSEQRDFSGLRYFYDCIVSAQNRYILFRDYDQNQSGLSRSLAVFKLMKSLDCHEILLLKSISLAEDIEGPGYCAFHPFLAQVFVHTSARAIPLDAGQR
jgi:hypothetical protein